MRPGPAGGSDRGLGVEEISVRYDDTIVLDRLSLDVGPGEVVAVVGPSGSGKSTLLRAVAGLEPLAGGRVVLGGRDLAPVPTHRRGLGLMFQDHGLFTHLDVAGNVAYGLEVAGVSGADRRARVAELLDLVGLAELAGRRVDQLSGGEAQRVALARALAPAPGLLMLDEPLGSLDRALREQLIDELRRLLGELGQTALHVTHDQSEAFALADRVAVIDGGRVLAIDRPARLWAEPGSETVAEFLGHPNRWSILVEGGGRVTADGVELGMLGPDHRLRRSGPGRLRAVLPVTAVRLGGSDRAGGDGVMAAIGDVVFDRGRYRVVGHIGSSTGGGGGVAIEFETTRPVEIGERCRLVLDLDRLQPLDAGG